MENKPVFKVSMLRKAMGMTFVKKEAITEMEVARRWEREGSHSECKLVMEQPWMCDGVTGHDKTS